MWSRTTDPLKPSQGPPSNSHPWQALSHFSVLWTFPCCYKRYCACFRNFIVRSTKISKGLWSLGHELALESATCNKDGTKWFTHQVYLCTKKMILFLPNMELSNLCMALCMDLQLWQAIFSRNSYTSKKSWSKKYRNYFANLKLNLKTNAISICLKGKKPVFLHCIWLVK